MIAEVASGSLKAELNEINRIGFEIPLDEFREMWEDAESYPQFDWTNDGCSDRNFVTRGSFGCIRHDWVYRNISLVDERHEFNGLLSGNARRAKTLADGQLVSGIVTWSDPSSLRRGPMTGLGVSLLGGSFFDPWVESDSGNVYGSHLFRREP